MKTIEVKLASEEEYKKYMLKNNLLYHEGWGPTHYPCVMHWQLEPGLNKELKHGRTHSGYSCFYTYETPKRSLWKILFD